MNPPSLSHADLLELKRWNTPTVYNGWEQITRRNPARDGFNLNECRDFMPQMGPMVGFAVTLTIQPSNPAHRAVDPSAYRRFVASLPGPKIVVVQDLDAPGFVGSMWGEVNSNTHRALGCVGTITDGCIRDLDEMTNAGFKAIAHRLCVGHAFATPIAWGEPVTVFGREVRTGDLIHADKHGFLVVPPEDQPRLLEATRFMDANECRTVIPAARSVAGLSTTDMLSQLDRAAAEFRNAATARFGGRAEW